jgi:hypothetical protein
MASIPMASDAREGHIMTSCRIVECNENARSSATHLHKKIATRITKRFFSFFFKLITLVPLRNFSKTFDPNWATFGPRGARWAHDIIKYITKSIIPLSILALVVTGFSFYTLF